MEFESIKRKHTDTMVELLSGKFLNEPSNIYTRVTEKLDVLKELRRRAFRLATIYSSEDYYYDLLIRFVHLMDDNLDFVDLLRNYFWNVLPIKDHLKFGIKRNNEVEKLGDLIHNLDFSNENQIMAFHNFGINEIYRQRIIQVSSFTLHGRSKLINDFRSTSKLNYDIVLPFHDKNYDPTSTDCTIRWDLPYFYRYH